MKAQRQQNRAGLSVLHDRSAAARPFQPGESLLSTARLAAQVLQEARAAAPPTLRGYGRARIEHPDQAKPASLPQAAPARSPCRVRPPPRQSGCAPEKQTQSALREVTPARADRCNDPERLPQKPQEWAHLNRPVRLGVRGFRPTNRSLQEKEDLTQRIEQLSSTIQQY